MAEPAEEMIVRNLIEALDRLHEDLDRVELWTARSDAFRRRCQSTSRTTAICCVGQDHEPRAEL